MLERRHLRQSLSWQLVDISLHAQSAQTNPQTAALPFTESESIAANESWSANCGPHALAAVLNVSLEAVRP